MVKFMVEEVMVDSWWRWKRCTRTRWKRKKGAEVETNEKWPWRLTLKSIKIYVNTKYFYDHRIYNNMKHVIT